MGVREDGNQATTERLVKKLVVFGSHDAGIPRATVADYLSERFRPDITLISGGASEVDSFAEQTWQALGGDVISLRPASVPDAYGWTVERWEIPASGAPIIFTPVDALIWHDWKSAAFWRNMMMAEEAEAGVAFVKGFSPGSRFTIDLLLGQHKPCAVHEC